MQPHALLGHPDGVPGMRRVVLSGCSSLVIGEILSRSLAA
ncbi:MAG: hypothetical protein KatS3mg004_1471 [Bryobacteraceae bacterium]|nr:MAG: hypothetical protein KatS3mg004_1471 [Bryobacteraceae bacterium]